METCCRVASEHHSDLLMIALIGTFEYAAVYVINGCEEVAGWFAARLYLVPHSFSLNGFLKQPLARQGPEQHIALMHYVLLGQLTIICPQWMHKAVAFSLLFLPKWLKKISSIADSDETEVINSSSDPPQQQMSPVTSSDLINVPPCWLWNGLLSV